MIISFSKCVNWKEKKSQPEKYRLRRSYMTTFPSTMLRERLTSLVLVGDRNRTQRLMA